MTHKRLNRSSVLLAFAPLLLVGNSLADGAGSELPACIDVSAHARPGASGYHHWVFIKNHCSQPAMCDVTTDVAATALTVTVQPNGLREVLTNSGAQNSKFTPYVTCKLGPRN